MCSSPNFIRVIKSRKIKWVGHLARTGNRRGAYRFSVGRPEVRRPLRRPRGRWEDNVKMDFQDVGWGCMDWSDLAEVGTGKGRLSMLIMCFIQAQHNINMESIIHSFVRTHRMSLHVTNVGLKVN